MYNESKIKINAIAVVRYLPEIAILKCEMNYVLMNIFYFACIVKI